LLTAPCVVARANLIGAGIPAGFPPGTFLDAAQRRVDHAEHGAVELQLDRPGGAGRGGGIRTRVSPLGLSAAVTWRAGSITVHNQRGSPRRRHSSQE